MDDPGERADFALRVAGDYRTPLDLEIRAAAATFFLACVRAGLIDEGSEFAEWYLETFDHDLET